jgi:GT2 family glycosyltransferase
MADPLDALYRQNTDYQAEHDGRYWLLSDAEGWGVACDEWVYRIWAAFDGRPTAQVVSAASLQMDTSAAFVESTAKVLARSGLLLPSHPLEPMGCLPSRAPDRLHSPPLVSIIVIAGRQARAHLETCLPSILAQTYPNLEIILVDNQTTDDSGTFVRQNFPQVAVIPADQPLGFDRANNLAMKQAQGEFFFLLNDDTELDPGCVAECVRVISQSDRIAAVVPKMKLYYMRSFLNAIGNSLYPDGLSCDNFVGYLDVGQFDETNQVFTACFGAAMLRSSAVKELGYLDESYSFYFEDMDWSFRARICGYDIVAAPQAVVYHKFNATMETLSSTFKLGLVARNRLRFIWKNLDFRRAWRLTRIYRAEDLRHVAWALEKGRKDIVQTYRRSWQQWVGSWPRLAVARWQTRRLRRPPFSDNAAFALVDRVPPPVMYGRYPTIRAAVVRNHYMRLEVFRPESPPAPEDLAQMITPPAVEVPTLTEKAKEVLREKGVRGLMEETWRYLYWRFAVARQRQ